MFKRVLIANRGEIAVRIIRACREMGIESVAVFSDVDRKALHVRKADYAYHIGPATASESYLNIAKILDVAQAQRRRSHPSRLRLSFRERRLCPRLPRCRNQVHRPVAGIDGDDGLQDARPAEHEARRRALRSGLGTRAGPRRRRAAGRADRLSRDAEGGGRRRRQGHAHGFLGARNCARPTRTRAAKRNAPSATTKSISRSSSSIPRHIEMQIFGDEHGNVVYLGERECSVQRRHQKVMEESPSPIVDEDMRRRMGEDRRPRRQSRRTITTPAPSSSWSTRIATSTSWR